jgi:hypothetical protein
MTTQNIYSLVDVWNSAGTTFTGIGLNVTDTASASGSLLLNLQVGGSSKFSVSKTGAVVSADTGSAAAPTFTVPGSGGGMGLFARSTQILGFAVNNQERMNLTTLGPNVRSDGYYAFSATTDPSFGSDVFLSRDAANTLALRNSTNAQVQHVYATYTDASNYERLKVGYSSSAFRVQAEKAGTGAARSLVLGTNGTDRWTLDGSTGHLLAATDNTYDIGASGATRPRNVFVGTNIISPQFSTNSFGFSATSGGYINFTSRAGFESPADGVLKLRNNADTDFSRLQFGGTTSSFPSLKRNGTTLQARLADDSSSAPFTAAQITASASTAIPANGSSAAALLLSSTASFGVYFGSGAPTVSAAKGSLYLRSDGSTTNDRMYVNTDGASTWTAVTTVA